jgi:HK97 family phage major capsid protein
MDSNAIAQLLAAPDPATKGAAVALHKQVHVAAKSLFDLGDNATTEDIARFDALATRGDALKAHILKFPDQAAMKARLDDHQKFIDTPVRPVPVDTGGGRGRFHVKGIEDAGYTELDAQRNVLNEVGAAVLGEKVWDAIQEPTYAKAFFKEYMRKGERMSGAAYKALESGLDDQGGYLAPPQMQSNIASRKPSPTRLGGMVENVSCGRDALWMPKVNYTANSSDDPNGYVFTTGFRATWTDELPSADDVANTSQANLFGTIRVPVYTVMIEGYLTNQQTEDAAFDVQGWYEGRFNQTNDLLRDQMILNGGGVQQPTGLATTMLAAGPTGDPIPIVTTAGAGVIAQDDLANVCFDLPEQYDDDAVWCFNKTSTYKALRKLKDSQNRYLFGYGAQDNGLANGRPKELLGYPFVWSQFMGNVATGNVPVWYGDPKGYTFVNRIGFSIQVLREVAARKNQIILLGRARFGGQVIEPWRFRGLKVA